MGLERKRRNMFWKSNLQDHEDHARQKLIQNRRKRNEKIIDTTQIDQNFK